MKKCSIKNCNNKALAKNLCGQHYQRWKKYGNALEPLHYVKEKTTKQKFICETCFFEFLRSRADTKRGRQRFCSRKCAYLKMKGEKKTIKPIEEREWRINRRGYLETTIRRERILQHRWVMEKYLGRKLSKNEFVHHLDGDKTNNLVSNLIILDSGLHSREHRKSSRENEIMRKLLELSLVSFDESLKLKIQSFLNS